jgi:ATP-binding protein involved in chromosome partitioning
MSLTSEAIIEALKSVRPPASKVSLVELQAISKIEVSEKSVLVEVTLPEVTVVIEKSIRYQIEKAVSALSSDAQVAVEFKTAKPAESEKPKIATLLAVGSGKGGVGKSSVSVNLAIAFQQLGYRVGILDCDIYGPSIPTMLNVEDQKPVMLDGKIQPIEAFGLKVMSAGFFVEKGQGLIWRGPMIHKLIQQFFQDVNWGELDVLVVDLPPGTGDAPLSLAQTMPLSGAVMVSMPQKVSLIDVHKGISMFQQVQVPILGVVENMSTFVCPHCKHEEEIFDRGGVKKFCGELGLSYLGDIPIEPKIRQTSDQGLPFMLDHKDSAAGKAITQIAKKLQPFLKSLEDASEEIRLIL